MNHAPENQTSVLLRKNRRAFYAIMTGAPLNIQSDFVNSPTE